MVKQGISVGGVEVNSGRGVRFDRSQRSREWVYLFKMVLGLGGLRVVTGSGLGGKGFCLVYWIRKNKDPFGLYVNHKDHFCKI